MLKRIKLSYQDLTHWLKSHVEGHREGWAYDRSIYVNYGYIMTDYDDYGNPTEFSQWHNPYWLSLIGYFAKLPYRAWIAWNCDHADWVNTSDIGPDHGTESGHCKRCGFSFHHTYF